MSTLAEVLRPHRLDTLNQDSGKHCRCGSDSRFDGWGNMDEHRAAVVAEWLTSEQAAEVAARAHYIASEDDREWAAGAWDDMGGSEPTYERAAAVIAMREALTALAAHAKGEVS